MPSTRRLAAIMFTDMVGSTASAQADEAVALKLRDEQEAIVRPLFSTFQGREIKSMGDGFLAVFDSALRAVQCAVAIQSHLRARNSDPGIHRIQLRIGVHVGEVEDRGLDVFGDSVNLASRIVHLASPGGICLTDSVFGQVRNKISIPLEKMAPQALKGIRFPVDVYRLILQGERETLPAPDVPTKGLAVLPITNISPDLKDAYFADGLTEELIGTLSQLRGLRIIARTSVTPYKLTDKGVAQIGSELGVSSILEGSVRKDGDRIRISFQLVDVASQGHLWSQTYDRQLADIFAIQIELAKRVMAALKVELLASDAARLEATPHVRADSYLAYLKGRGFLNQGPHGYSDAKEQFELAVELDPANAPAHSGLADVTRMSGWFYPGVPRPEWDLAGRRMVNRALELNPDLPEAHASLGLILWDDYEYSAAEKEFKRALSLNPSYSLARQWYAALLEDEGRGEEAVQEYTLAEAVDPASPHNQYSLALLNIYLGRLEEAHARIQSLGKLQPDGWLYHGVLSRLHYARGDMPRCLDEIKRLEELEPEPRRRALIRANYSALSGRNEEARAILREEAALPEFPLRSGTIAAVYADLGDLDECFQWLTKAIALQDLAFQHWRLDPRFESVRSDPRFTTLLETLGLA